ncbi:hypothetical protein GMB34_13510 [Turicibacter sanguinis]|uniref:hypothetical protein n=1 Tax=Turicibacter sanguinis TaxID=154288 RepID=UPI0012BD2DA8|nr:hypothetical protein [Turicibacter sanguinis]MDB8436744.1 hypothetical protein [Turicibacter sanguinis]MTN80716.1 hypothetical protein [Turicibacter sanguinis]MTN85232.1 hypothetical protein [Turicibacter sanguinis]MTN88053.1 hypothetical protein [Turicibacter sanguinis]MTN90907.1 hypothetical protein [Turicibacter sanguinis]
MLKPLMQIPPTVKLVSYDGKLQVRLNELFEFEFIYKTSQLVVHIPAPKGNPVPRMIYDSLTLTSEESEDVLTFITKYFELNHKEVVREMINGKSDIPIRPTIS